MPGHIEFRCRCGRALRAKPEQVGSVVRCWSCHNEQIVPDVQGRSRLARAYIDILRGVFRNNAAGPLLLGAAVFAGVSALPWVGAGLALVLAGWAAGHYDRLFATPADNVEPGSPRWTRRSLAFAGHWAVGIVAVFLWILPFVLRYAGLPLSGRRWPFAAAVLAPLALACWVLVPLSLFALSARERHGPGSTRRAFEAARNHPLAIACALLLVPLGIVLIELVLILGTWQQGRLANLVLDLFPTPQGVVPTPGNAYPSVDIANLPDARLFRFYGEGLRQGFTLTGSIPASLPLGIDVRQSPSNILVEPRFYLAFRFILTTLIYWAVASLLVVQARWLARAGVSTRRLPQENANGQPTEGQTPQNGSRGTTVVLTPWVDHEGRPI